MTVDQSAEILRLRATVRDLLALSTIPEAWVGREPPAIASELADLLIESLELDFAFVRLCDPTGGRAVDVMRGDSWKAFPEWLQDRLTVSGQISRKEIVTKVGGVGESCCGIVIPIGVNGERGLVAAACDRSDFPNQIDQQLLSVAANNAATAFRNAHLINELRSAQEALRDSEQALRKARDELEIKVAERTSELQRSAQELQRSEFYLAEGQRLGHSGSWVFDPSGSFTYWSQELFRIYGLDPASAAPSLTRYLACIHPQDREFMTELIREMVAEGLGCDAKKRIVRADGEVRYIRCVGIPLLENGALKSILGTAMDVTEQEQLTQELQRREAYLAEAQRLSHTGSFGWRPDTGEIVWSDETYRIFEYNAAEKPTLNMVLQRIHPQDRAFAQQVIEDASKSGADFEHEYRLVLPSGAIKHVHVRARDLHDSSGAIEFVGAVMDVTTAKQIEETIRQQETELRQILDVTPQQVGVSGPDGTPLYANRAALEYFGISLDQWRGDLALHQAAHSGRSWLGSRLELVHPEDREHFVSERKKRFLEGAPHEFEARLLRHDGQFRWFLFRLNPLKDERGHVTRWYGTATDIEDRKQAEKRLRQENVALREEVDKASMFEEIVGASPALRAVLSGVAQVGPTDSTVLITGETGTGKELIARAVHKQSPRSSRAFVSVNCAAIPQNLIASELFGHEKGAFTGALQRRVGRFELAERGTIFLDEVGDLPAETQVALLRVLQEREFERVGGNQAIRADVRVVAATNRDLQAAIEAGTFRDDLFYRLNVFPIHIPPLRERKEDIPILVEYFIGRYAAKSGKKIRNVKKKTLDLMQSYPWPGNIRELQNVIERSVIVCEAETLSVDESWLSRGTALAQDQGLSSRASARLPLSKRSMVEEKQVIETALAEARGKVSGPLGAATRLGVPASTLESKIRALKINKHRFRTA